MALLFRGHTICPLCGKAILTDQAAVAFPAFLKKTHALGAYSDAAFHRQCFDKSPDRIAVTKLFDRSQEIWQSRSRGLKTQEEMDEWGKSAFAEFE